MRRKKGSTYETRGELLERIRRQKQAVKELIAERDELKRLHAAMGIYQSEASMRVSVSG